MRQRETGEGRHSLQTNLFLATTVFETNCTSQGSPTGTICHEQDLSIERTAPRLQWKLVREIFEINWHQAAPPPTNHLSSRLMSLNQAGCCIFSQFFAPRMISTWEIGNMNLAHEQLRCGRVHLWKLWSPLLAKQYLDTLRVNWFEFRMELTICPAYYKSNLKCQHFGRKKRWREWPQCLEKCHAQLPLSTCQAKFQPIETGVLEIGIYRCFKMSFAEMLNTSTGIGQNQSDCRF